MSNSLAASTALTAERVTWIVEAASVAPSIHNSQPWQFTAHGDELWLHGTPARALSIADPHARGLYISCGAALSNARIAARNAGLEPEIELLPHPEYPLDVLAVLRMMPGLPPTPGESNLYQAIWRRHTNRGPFSGRQIPRLLVAGLQKSATSCGAALRMLDGPGTATVLRLAAEAGRELAADKPHQDELRRWIGDGRADGIPTWALPDEPRSAPSPVRDGDFLAARPRPERSRAAYEHFPQLAVLTTDHDEPEDWLRAGQALEHVLLVATLNHLSASFLYQVIERDDMRETEPRSWPWPERPQMIIRLGYGASALPTPRRSTADVMRSGDSLRIG
jgi:nitroreductase